jgi:hypothetical protein
MFVRRSDGEVAIDGDTHAYARGREESPPHFSPSLSESTPTSPDNGSPQATGAPASPVQRTACWNRRPSPSRPTAGTRSSSRTT